MAESTPAIEVSDLIVRLRGATILEHVSFTLKGGEFLGIIGPNGGGKTVLLKTLVGLIEPSAGQIRIFGETPIHARRYVGYVPQFARFDTDFPVSVLDAVLMGRLGCNSYVRPYTKHDRDVVETLLDKLELSGKRHTQIGKLSGGQTQRVLIARALAAEPKVLLLDEPSASLDTRIGKTLYDFLRELSAGLTIVLVSHDIGVIAEYVQAVACLNKTLHYHGSKEITSEMIQEAYGCPLELLAHGHAHRVLGHHHGEHDHPPCSPKEKR